MMCYYLNAHFQEQRVKLRRALCDRLLSVHKLQYLLSTFEF